MSIVTKKGDKGDTSLLSGEIVRKYDIRPDTYGKIDELFSFLGIIYSLSDDFLKEEINIVQRDLIKIMAEISLVGCKNDNTFKIEKITSENVKFLEEKINLLEENLPKMKEFEIPGSNLFSSYLHVCRAICREVERKVVFLSDKYENINENILIYINRLSDYLFLLARKYK